MLKDFKMRTAEEIAMQLDKQFATDQRNFSAFLPNQADMAFKETTGLILSQRKSVQEDLYEKRRAARIARMKQMLLVAVGLFVALCLAMAIAGMALAVAAFISPYVLVAGLSISVLGGMAAIIAKGQDVVEAVKDPATYDPIKKMWQGLKETTWDRFWKYFEHLKAQAKAAKVLAEQYASKAEAVLKKAMEIETKIIKASQGRITSEPSLSIFVQPNIGIKGKRKNNTEFLIDFFDEYHSDPGALIGEPENLEMLRAALLDDNNILRLATLLPDQVRPLLSRLITGKGADETINLFGKMLAVIRSASVNLPIDASANKVISRSLKDVFTMTDDKDLKKRAPRLLMQLRDAIEPHLSAENLQKINHHIVEAQKLVGKFGWLSWFVRNPESKEKEEVRY